MNCAIRSTKYVFYTALFLLPAAVPLLVYFRGNWYSFFHGYSVGMWVGILSYACLLNTLILSARIPVLDRIFGHDRVMVFHGYMAILGLALGILHHELKGPYFTEETVQTGLGTAALAVFFAVITAALLLLVNGRLHYIPLLAKLKSMFGRTRAGDYSTLKLLHNSVIMGVLLVTLHVMLASSTREHSLRTWVTGVYGAAGIAVWGYHKFIRVLHLHRNAWKVKGRSHPGPGITELILTRNEPLNGHREGQFAYLRFRSEEIRFEEHPFTISSPPGKTDLTFTVKNLGDYTSLLSRVEPGTKVLLDGPYGRFTPPLTEKPLLFIAGGIGITPFMSILRDWHEKGFKGPVTLVWSCRTSEDLIHREFFESCAAENKQFAFIPVLTREGEKQRITREFLENLPGSQPESIYFCGPEPLRRACTRYLRKMGIPAGKIHYERFS